MSAARYFFLNDTATTAIYTLSLHDALPIYLFRLVAGEDSERSAMSVETAEALGDVFSRSILLKDRKSTRLNSSHSQISYAVFCLKKKRITLWCLRITQAHTYSLI